MAWTHGLDTWLRRLPVNTKRHRVSAHRRTVVADSGGRVRTRADPTAHAADAAKETLCDPLQRWCNGRAAWRRPAKASRIHDRPGKDGCAVRLGAVERGSRRTG